MTDDLTKIPNFRCATREECDTSIQIGDTVRSYDFEYKDDCFVEGPVTKIFPVEGCDRYNIETTRRVWGGIEYPLASSPPVFLPPVNGTRVAGSGEFTNGVRKLSDGLG